MKMNTLVSFHVCPFVQRSLIVLEEKGVREHYDIRYIDLEARPDWFLHYSPMGQVPILIVGDTVLFESAAINEFIAANNDHPKPFVWTASVEKILAKIRHCKAILETVY